MKNLWKTITLGQASAATDYGIIRKKARNIRIEFSKYGWKRFGKLNLHLADKYIRAYELKKDLALYISAFEQAGRKLDTMCEVIRYTEEVTLMMKKEHGVWYITDVESTVPAPEFEPVYFWVQIKRGFELLLARFMIGWRNIKPRPERAQAVTNC